MTIDLNKVYALGLEKFAGDEEKAVEFTKGFQKAAFDMPNLFFDTKQDHKPGGVLPAFLEGAGKGLGGAAVTGLVGLIGAGVGSVSNGALHTKFLQTLEQAITSSRILKEAKRDRVVQYAETVFKFSPHVACDVNLLTHVLAGSVHGDGLDINTIKMLTDLETRYKDSSGFNPKSWV